VKRADTWTTLVYPFHPLDVVGWHGNSIVDAIVSGKDGWEKPDGSPTAAVSLKRHPC
jgi:hypothetical protein